MPRSTVAANTGDALVPVTAEAERAGSVRDEREAELAEKRGVAFLVERFKGREVLPEHLSEECRLPWTVVRPGGWNDGCLGNRIQK